MKTDTEHERIIEKIRKVYELTQSDIEGEREAATARLNELCAKYNLSVADIVSDREEWFYFETGRLKTYKHLLKQIYGCVTNRTTVNYREGPTKIGFEMTKVQAVEVGNMFAFYRRELAKELKAQTDLIVKAFVYKNDLVPHGDEDDNAPKELSAEEKAKLLQVLALMQGMERKHYNKQLENGD